MPTTCWCRSVSGKQSASAARPAKRRLLAVVATEPTISSSSSSNSPNRSLGEGAEQARWTIAPRGARVAPFASGRSINFSPSPSGCLSLWGVPVSIVGVHAEAWFSSRTASSKRSASSMETVSASSRSSVVSSARIGATCWGQKSGPPSPKAAVSIRGSAVSIGGVQNSIRSDESSGSGASNDRQGLGSSSQSLSSPNSTSLDSAPSFGDSIIGPGSCCS